MRVSPIEVSLSDPDNYDRIYYQQTRYTKAPEMYVMFGAKTSALVTESNELYRIRRSAMNPFFSRKRVLDLEDVVQSKVKKLVDRLATELEAGKPVDLHYGFRAISVDVATDYAFGLCYDLLHKDNFGMEFNQMVREFTKGMWIFEQFPFVLNFVLAIPPAWGTHLGEPLASYAAFVKVSLMR